MKLARVRIPQVDSLHTRRKDQLVRRVIRNTTNWPKQAQRLCVNGVLTVPHANMLPNSTDVDEVGVKGEAGDKANWGLGLSTTKALRNGILQGIPDHYTKGKSV